MTLCVVTLLNYSPNTSGAAVVRTHRLKLESREIFASVSGVRALKGADDLLSNRLETERGVIDLPVNVRLLPEDHQAAPCLKRPNYHLARAPRREIISHRLFPSSFFPTCTFSAVTRNRRWKIRIKSLNEPTNTDSRALRCF